MDAKKAYRGAKAVLRTAERRNQELKERNLALAYGARPTEQEAQAAQEYVEELERELANLRLDKQELIWELRDAEADVAELKEEVEELERKFYDSARMRRFGLMLELGMFIILTGAALYWYWY